MTKKSISILLPDFSGGGAERANLELAYEFARREYYVEFVLMQIRGELLAEAQSAFSIINLNCSRLRGLPKILINYLRKSRPDILITSMWPLTIIAPLSKMLSRQDCKVLICEQNFLSVQYQKKSWLNWIIMRATMALCYRLAFIRIGVSTGVVNDIASLSGLSKQMFDVVHNPVKPYAEPLETTIQYVEGLWSCPSGARIVTVGSFKKQKNHKLLLEAFSQINLPDARLMFVGDGEGRESLISFARQLGISDKIIIAGFQFDPTPFYKTADLFVLSSDYEGFGNVIVESLSCGTPVVSTDCPSGPAEILDNGRFGILVPVRDVDSLSNAIRLQLETKVNRNFLKKRAEEFSPEIAASKYLRLLKEIN